MNFGFTVEERHGVRVVRLRGELDLATADELGEGLSNFDGPSVLDLAELTFIDSSGIAVLVREYNRRGRLVLTNPRPNVARVLRIAGLDGWVRHRQPDADREPAPIASPDAGWQAASG